MHDGEVLYVARERELATLRIWKARSLDHLDFFLDQILTSTSSLSFTSQLHVQILEDTMSIIEM